MTTLRVNFAEQINIPEQTATYRDICNYRSFSSAFEQIIKQ